MHISKHVGLLALVVCAGLASAQQKSLALEPFFSAIIVTEMDSALLWYKETLGFSVVNQQRREEFGLKQANLKHGQATLELIEINEAI
ncbi:MAG: hypothetical protein OEQ53_01890, partial [Saprospiraceae bacterium]|nr:hypothetical protein [Saprospiraceae bacterium]